MGKWRYSSTHILNLGTKWKWVIRFVPWLLYPWWRSPQYHLNRGLGGPQSQSGNDGKETNPYPCWESNPGHAVQRLVTILSHPGSPYTQPKHIIWCRIIHFWTVISAIGLGLCFKKDSFCNHKDYYNIMVQISLKLGSLLQLQDLRVSWHWRFKSRSSWLWYM